MNDPIKRFVKQNREAFDHLEPPAEVLLRLKAQLGPARVARKSFFLRYQRASWLVAASLLVGLGCAYFLFDDKPPALPSEPYVAQQPIPEAPVSTPSVEEREDTPDETAEEQPRTEPVRRVAAASRPETKRESLAKRLADSSSASLRLAAILEIEQSGQMDDQLRSMLSETMNRDDNTNVRLAALDVLSHHLQDPQVADLLAAALTSQDDPLVQLGIVKVAAALKHVGIEEALFAVARNPYTFAAVKDEAYAVLLHQDKL